jgi:hypothetical protein
MTRRDRTWVRFGGWLLVGLSLLPAGCAPNLRSVDPDDLFASATHLVHEIGPRVPGTPQHAQAGEYLLEKLESYGLTEASFQNSDPGLGQFRNVVAREAGTTYPDWIILAGAHYDTTKDCVGAMDNGSGVCTLLAIAKYFAAHPPAYTMEFVFFDREETGYWGSQGYHQKTKAAGGLARTLVMMNLDMTQGNYLARGGPFIFFIMTPNFTILKAAQEAQLRTGLFSMSVWPISTSTAKAMSGGSLRSDSVQWAGDKILLVWPWAYALPSYYNRVPGSITQLDKAGLATATQFSIELLCALQANPPEKLMTKR